MASKTPTSDDPNFNRPSTQTLASGSLPVVMVQGQRSLREETQHWNECISQWFPDLLNATYFVPLIHFNRVPYDFQSIARQDVLVVKYPNGGAGTDQGQSGHAVSKRRRRRKKGQDENHEPKKRIILQTSYQSQRTSQVNTLQQTSQVSTPQQTSQVSTSQFDKKSLWTPANLSMGELPRPVLDSDVRDDRAVTQLLCRFQEMTDSQTEVMMVMTEYKFSNYLKKLTTDIASQLPRPSVQGNFDLLIIHRKYGLLVGEMKSVGANRKELGVSPQDFERILGEKIVQAARQMKKTSNVVQRLVSDIAPGMTCHASLILPCVATDELSQFLQANHQSAKKDLCECLACPDNTDFTEFFLCADHLSSVSALSGWWQGWKRRNGVHPLMSDDLYQQMVARFVGPASTVQIHCVTPPRVELRTPGEGVAETGERMTRLVLTPDQVDLLTRRPPRVYITGPPGTGKTVVLVLIALQWLGEGHDVHVVSLDSRSRAASHLIEHQLQRSLDANVTSSPGNVHRHKFDLQSDDMDRTVNTLSCLANNDHLYLIIDEISVRSTVGIDLKRFQSFCDQLVVRVPHLHLWAASLYHKDRPRVLKEEKLTTALRCPPVIVQKVRHAPYIEKDKSVYDYSDTEIPAPTHGPPIMHLKHIGDGHDGHTKTRYVDQCEQCGTNLARVLKKLTVGPFTSSSSSTVNNNTSSPLMYRDVFVLCRFDRIKRNVGFVQGLLKAGIPVQVLNDNVGVRDMTLGLHDRVTVARYYDVQGLERKVVVVVEYMPKDEFDLFFSASRCTSQLIWIGNSSNRIIV